MSVLCLSVNSSWNVINFRSELIKSFIDHGYEVLVISPSDEYSDRIVKLGAKHVAIDLDQQGTSILKDFKLLLNYLRILSNETPDVYLSFTVKPNIYGSIACSILRIPVINNVAGLGTAFLNGGFLGFCVINFYRLAFLLSKFVFFQNIDDLNLFVGKKVVSKAQVDLLPGSGVNLNRFNSVPYNPRPKESTEFLYVGRLIKDKGVVELVEAAKLVKEHYPNVKIKLLGALGVANRSACSENEVMEWQAQGLIEYCGVTDDVRSYTSKADCVVLPSYREGTPRVLLEAGALQRPLIATDVPGCRQVVDDDVNGYLCRVRDSYDLAAAMIRFLELTNDRKKAMARSSRLKIESEYDEKIVINKYLKALDECL